MSARPTTGAAPPHSGAAVRVLVWALHMALPLGALWLFLARPAADVRWEHQGAHFAIVVAVAAVNVVLGVLVGEDARRHGDARLLLVSLAFFTSAAFLGLHALATPGVVLPRPNAGFVIATPVGLLLASGFAVWSSLELSPAAASAVLRRQAALRLGAAAVVVGWAVLSLGRLPPLDQPLPPERARGPLLLAAVVATALYAVAAGRFFALHRRRPSAVLLSLVTAFVLLAQAMLAVAVSRSWHASWWQWHLLMTAAFFFVAYSARLQRLREGSGRGLFAGAALEQTVRRVRAEYGAALEALVDAIERRPAEVPPGGGGGADGAPLEAVAARLGDRFGLTERQQAVLLRAAEALAAEREQIRRLGALVAIGTEASVIQGEQALVDRAWGLVADAFGEDRLDVGVLEGGRLRWRADGHAAPPELVAEALAGRQPAVAADGHAMVVPLLVKGRPAGALSAVRTSGVLADRDRWMLLSLAAQLSIALENARVYAQLDGLFRSYMSPDVATALLADPSQAALGGAVVEVTALMADLGGFTSFSERTSPEAVVGMLNTYFGAVVPCLLDEGGTVVQFMGDAVLALFGAPVAQPDHALRAGRAALAVQQAVGVLAAGQPDWPRFRVGISSGPALVGNVGSLEFRSFTAIGDTINLAARLEASAALGQVVISERTCRLLGSAAQVESLGALEVKGKQDPVQAFALVAVPGGAAPSSSRA